MPRRKKPDPMTVVEFKSYLQGIIDFSGDDWAPNKTQWKKIYDIIQELKEPEPVVAAPAPVVERSPLLNGGQGHATQMEPTIVESSMTPRQEVPAHERTDIRKPGMTRPGAAKVAEGGQVASSGVTIVTPNKEEGDTTSDFM